MRLEALLEDNPGVLARKEDGGRSPGIARPDGAAPKLGKAGEGDGLPPFPFSSTITQFLFRSSWFSLTCLRLTAGRVNESGLVVSWYSGAKGI